MAIVLMNHIRNVTAFIYNEAIGIDQNVVFYPYSENGTTVIIINIELR